MPKVESFVQTPDGPGNVKSIDLLRETVKVSLDNGPEGLKQYRNCEIRILRNGKGSRDGIDIGERTERYVEEREDELLVPPIIATPFFVDEALEEAPIREKMSEESEGGKPRHRGRRGRRGGKAAAALALMETAMLSTLWELAFALPAASAMMLCAVVLILMDAKGVCSAEKL